ncbi:MAG: acetate/propionate family kinase [Christensenellales bacterium]|jgi:acetate kinase
MKILVLNSGSSSLKYQLFDMNEEKLLAKGLCQRVGIDGSLLEHKVNGKKYDISQPMPTHKEALALVVEALTNEEYGVIKSIDEIDGFGHRYVNGGEEYKDPMIVTPDIIEKFRERFEFAPLHNPANLMGIEACMALAKGVKNVAVFDTGFYKNLPDKSKLYAIDYNLYKDHKIHRFGAHGTSHDFVSEAVAKEMGKNREDLKIITCHLGNGASISAIDKGVCVDTSMGFTPLEGVMMGTRSGDIDAAVVPFLMNKLNKTADEIITMLNKQSGLLGVSGVSSDIRDVQAQAATNERARIALEMFIYKIRKYIGAYAAAMGGVDVIVFTAGTGENRPELRELMVENMEFMGVELDRDANNNFVRGENWKFSKPNSRVALYVIPTDEEFAIAKITKNLIKA